MGNGSNKINAYTEFSQINLKNTKTQDTLMKINSIEIS